MPSKPERRQSRAWTSGTLLIAASAHRDAGAWIAGYADYLRDVLGADDTTRLRHLPTVRRFIAACSGPGAPAPDWTGLSVQQVTEFIQREAAQRTGHGRAAPASATRSFLRFLAWYGTAPSGLDRAIPSVRRARHASLPTHLSAEQLARLLERPAAPRPAEYRDRAILSLLAGLGLRAGEVAALELNDLDWHAGQLRLCAGKCRRERCCPCRRRPAPRSPSICGTPARPVRTVGCSSHSPIQRGPSRLLRSPRPCGAIWYVPASHSGG